MPSRTLAVIAVAFAVLAASVAAPAGAQRSERASRIEGHPDLNGIWQALNTAHWNLEAHPAEALDRFWQLGAIASIPAGRSVVREGKIAEDWGLHLIDVNAAMGNLVDIVGKQSKSYASKQK